MNNYNLHAVIFIIQYFTINITFFVQISILKIEVNQRIHFENYNTF